VSEPAARACCLLGHVKHDTADAPTARARMRFINRSHREGPLGSVLGAAAQDGDDLAGGVAGYRAAGRLLEQYPLLPEVLGMSAPEATHYQPGDVTLHHGCESSLTSKLCDFARVDGMCSLQRSR